MTFTLPPQPDRRLRSRRSSPRPPSRARRRSVTVAHGDVVGEEPARPRRVGRTPRPAHHDDERRAPARRRVSRRSHRARPSACSMRSRPARPKWATRRRSSGTGNCRARPSSPRRRSAWARLQHQTWIEHRGGQQLWDELYQPARRARPARRQHRPVHGRLVPQAGRKPRRHQGAAHPRAGHGRRSLRRARRDAAIHSARRHLSRARTRHDRRRGNACAGERSAARPAPHRALSTTCRASTSPTARAKR